MKCKDCKYNRAYWEEPCRECKYLWATPAEDKVDNFEPKEVDVEKETKDPYHKDQHEPGAKLDLGKPMAGCLGQFARALMYVAKISTYGCNKYTRGGWQEVPNGLVRYEDALWRHLLQGYISETDEESELLHLGHRCWNDLAQLELYLRQGEQDAPK